MEVNNYTEFIINGVISANTVELASIIRESVRSVCMEIIDAYKICSSQKTSKEEVESVLLVIPHAISPHFQKFVQYVNSETEECPVESVQKLLVPIRNKVVNLVNKFEDDYGSINEFNEEIFFKVFGLVKTILEFMSDFFEHRYKVEVHRVAEIGKNAISEIKILHALTSNELLVKRIERSNIYCDDFIKNVGILCTGQNSNPNLPSKFKQVVLLFQGDYPLFLQSLENKLCNDGDPSIELEYYNKIVNILEELTKILREISIIFNTQLEKVSGRQRSKSTNVRALNNVVDGLINNLAKLNTVVDEQEQKKLSQGLQDETKKSNSIIESI